MSQHGEQLAEDVLSLAESAAMPDSYWQHDSRIQRALRYLSMEDWSREQVQEWLDR